MRTEGEGGHLQVKERQVKVFPEETVHAGLHLGLLASGTVGTQKSLV